MSADGNKILVSIRVYDDEGLWNMEIGGDPRNRARTRTSKSTLQDFGLACCGHCLVSLPQQMRSPARCLLAIPRNVKVRDAR